MPGDVRLLSTTSTLRTPGTRLSRKSTLRLEPVACTPCARSSARLAGPPAVATGTARRLASTCSAARPTPPAAACTSTRLRGRTAAASPNADSTVANTVGMVDASSAVRLGGMGTMVLSGASTHVPRLPVARPNTALPAAAPAATTPAQSEPGSPASPGYMPCTRGASVVVRLVWLGAVGVG
jgi:hypothetical protein